MTITPGSPPIQEVGLEGAHYRLMARRPSGDEAEATFLKKRKQPKTHLRLPDLEYSKTAVLNSLTSADSQRGYGHAIDEFVDWYCSEPRLALNGTVVLRYRTYIEARQLAPGTINLRLGAVRRLAYEAADSGLLRMGKTLGGGYRRRPYGTS